MIAKARDFPKRLTPQPVQPSVRRAGLLFTILKPLASLRLTVVLLAITTLLVYVGTSAQKDIGNWEAQRQYFHSWFAWVDFRLLVPLWRWGFESLPGGFPMPGGYALILALLANLLAAHTVRFKLTAKRSGVILIHAGLILLIIGEVVTSFAAVESQMSIDEGQTVQFAEDVRNSELAIVDTTPADHNDVVSIPQSKLRAGAVISYPTVPFTIRVEKVYQNATILGPQQARQTNRANEIIPTAGGALRAGIVAMEQPPVTGLGNALNTPAAFITLLQGNENLGTFLVTAAAATADRIDVGGKTFEFALRHKRHYKPYTMELIDFSFDKYTGTTMSKNFSSVVRLRDPRYNEDREIKIWMNHPLRHAGETFYQLNFDPRTEATTVLQVVRNPGWLIPYISCAVVSLGLLIHFGITLVSFLRRTKFGTTLNLRPGERATLRPRTGGVLWPAIVTAACAVYLLAAGRPPKTDTAFDFNAFGRTPINFEGRVMPMDSLARISLRVISGRSEVTVSKDKTLPAIQWLADVFARSQDARKYEVFRVDHPDVLSLLSLDPSRKRFSFDEVMRASAKLDEQIERMKDIPANERDAFQQRLMELASHLRLMIRLMSGSELYIAAPMTTDGEWQTLETAARASEAGQINPSFAGYVSMLSSYANDDAKLFNASADGYLGWIADKMPATARKLNFEAVMNYFDPFYHAITLYVLAFLLVCASFLIAPAQLTLRRTAFWILLLTLAYHSAALLARIYIQGRPPVTNLYSSAIFIGWGTVVFCTVLEMIYRNGIGTLASSMIAFPSLIIAHYLAPIQGNGDTMQMLQAVLDTNLWLATHVVIVTLGYAATFLAGGVACAYVIGSWFVDETRIGEFTRTLIRIIYGVLCFALLFSFVGTVLGGIWADQSWGRFWGWDPKENGAVMIVLWNAIILHARWGGMIKARGLAMLAIGGNVVTAWSWFGTNLLGAGLHSYGFMDSGVRWLGIFAASQLLIIGIALLPKRSRAPQIAT